MLSDHTETLLLSLLSCLLSSGEAVRLGSTTTLSCPSPGPWFFCVWVSPSQGRSCHLRDQLGTDLCGGEERLVMTGNQSACHLTIAGVRLEDHGEWTCALSDSQTLETVKQKMVVLVEVVGEVSLTRVGEGVLTQLVCRVTGAWPRPHIQWTSDWSGLVSSTPQERLDQDPSSHLLSVSQVITNLPTIMMMMMMMMMCGRW